MDNLILKLISSLNENEDLFLIALLKEKLDSNYQLYLKKTSVTDKEITRAKAGCERIIKTFVYNQISSDLKYKKREKILANQDCEKCKHSIEKRFIYKDVRFDMDIDEMRLYYNEDSDICTQCCRKNEILFDLNSDMDTEGAELIEETIESENIKSIFKTKAIINKLTLKLKNYDAS